MDHAILNAVEAVIERTERDKIVLPAHVLNIPKDCYENPRPTRVIGRTNDFLKLLDSEVRKAPAKGVPVKDACKMMEQFGSTLVEVNLYHLLARTQAIHVLTIKDKHVRLSTKELLEKIARERVA